MSADDAPSCDDDGHESLMDAPGGQYLRSATARCCGKRAVLDRGVWRLVDDNGAPPNRG